MLNRKRVVDWCYWLEEIQLCTLGAKFISRLIFGLIVCLDETIKMIRLSRLALDWWRWYHRLRHWLIVQVLDHVKLIRHHLGRHGFWALSNRSGVVSLVDTCLNWALVQVSVIHSRQVLLFPLLLIWHVRVGDVARRCLHLLLHRLLNEYRWPVDAL